MQSNRHKYTLSHHRRTWREFRRNGATHPLARLDICSSRHGAWTSAPLKAHPSTECRCTAPQIETPICTSPLSNSSVYLTTTTYVRRSGRITNGMQSGWTTPQDSAFSSRHRHPWPVLSRFDRFRLIGPRAKGGSALLLTNANLHFLSKLLVYSTGQARNQLGSPGGAKSIVLARNSSVF